MKKFIIKTSIFVLIALGFVITILLMQDRRLIVGRKKIYLEDQVNKNFDLLVMGSSRAEDTFNPNVHEGGLRIFNIGEKGHGLSSNYLMLKVLLKKHNLKPKRILLQTDEISFNGIKELNGRSFMDNYFVTDLDDEEVYDAFVKYRGENIAKLMKTFPASSNFLYADFYKLMKNQLLSTKTFIPTVKKQYDANLSKYAESKGYIPVSPSKDIEVVHKNLGIDKDDREYFEKFVQLCKENNIELHLYRAPILYCENFKSKTFDSYIAQFSAENNIPFYDYKCSYQWPDQYHNIDHSCDSVSVAITKDLLSKMKLTDQPSPKYILGSISGK